MGAAGRDYAAGPRLQIRDQAHGAGRRAVRASHLLCEGPWKITGRRPLVGALQGPSGCEPRGPAARCASPEACRGGARSRRTAARVREPGGLQRGVVRALGPATERVGRLWILPTSRNQLLGQWPVTVSEKECRRRRAAAEEGRRRQRGASLVQMQTCTKGGLHAVERDERHMAKCNW